MSNVLDNITPKEVPGIKTIYRGDTGQPMGVVGNTYKIFQNYEMIELFENLANGHKIIFETCGALNIGETVWCMARIPDLKLDIGGDELNTYMFISNGHIGNRTLTVAGSTTRIVCQNTLTIATQEFRNRLKKNGGRKNPNTGYAIRHTTNMHLAIKEVEQAYASLLVDVSLTKEMFEAMMKTPVTTVMKNRFFDFIVDPTKDETDSAKEISKRGETRRNNKKEELEKLYESATNQTPASKNTVWGLYNCVTEMVDHTRQTRCAENKEENSCRFESSMFGSGKDLKDIAFSKAMELVATA
jgi:phage/plasmid-like protein (TIGR03299 family)